MLPTLLSEGLSETRSAAKTIVASLMREARQSPAEMERLERLLRRYLSDSAYRKLRDSVETVDLSVGHNMMAGGHQMGATNPRNPKGPTDGSRRACSRGGGGGSAAGSGGTGGEPTGGGGGGSDEPL